MLCCSVECMQKTENVLAGRKDVLRFLHFCFSWNHQQETLCLNLHTVPLFSPYMHWDFSGQLLIDGILGTLVIFLVLELLICITAMLFGLSVLAAGGTQVSSDTLKLHEVIFHLQSHTDTLLIYCHLKKYRQCRGKAITLDNGKWDSSTDVQVTQLM